MDMCAFVPARAGRRARAGCVGVCVGACVCVCVDTMLYKHVRNASQPPHNFLSLEY